MVLKSNVTNVMAETMTRIQIDRSFAGHLPHYQMLTWFGTARAALRSPSQNGPLARRHVLVHPPPLTPALPPLASDVVGHDLTGVECGVWSV